MLYIPGNSALFIEYPQKQHTYLWDCCFYGKVDSGAVVEVKRFWDEGERRIPLRDLF